MEYVVVVNPVGKPTVAYGPFFNDYTAQEFADKVLGQVVPLIFPIKRIASTVGYGSYPNG